MKTHVWYTKDGENGTLAIFPYIKEKKGYMFAFSVNDGHTICSIDYVKECKPIDESEYKYLNRLLFGFYGYDTKPIKKINWKKVNSL
jgi:hypothetical protein